MSLAPSSLTARDKAIKHQSTESPGACKMDACFAVLRDHVHEPPLRNLCLGVLNDLKLGDIHSYVVRVGLKKHCVKA